MENQFLKDIRKAVRIENVDGSKFKSSIQNLTELPSYFDVSGLASASMLAVGEATAQLLEAHELAVPYNVGVDQNLASHWFNSSLQLTDVKAPPVWDNVAGDYQGKDGWIRLHTNAPHHKAAALSVLDVEAERHKVAGKVAQWSVEDLETQVVAANGCAAAMRSINDWAKHTQGIAVGQEPLVSWSDAPMNVPVAFETTDAQRPLAGLKVLDLTRVIAGPVGTRTLASLGANVLRIDPVTWDEPGLYEDLTVGKRCAHLDLKAYEGRDSFLALIEHADVFVHGLRKDALDKLGLDQQSLLERNPNLIDVALNAYGWTGPWANRRGFDSLVQMSSGIADHGMQMSGNAKPTPLPVQALDHATGYLVAATVISALRRAKANSKICSAKLSLARVAHLLTPSTRSELRNGTLEQTEAKYTNDIEQTHLGNAQRLHQAVSAQGVDMSWRHGAPALRSSDPTWG